MRLFIYSSLLVCLLSNSQTNAERTHAIGAPRVSAKQRPQHSTGKGDHFPNDKFSQAIGKFGSCYATLVSPPESEVSVVLTRGSWGSGNCAGRSLRLANGRKIEGFQCLDNKDYASNTFQKNSNLSVCYSTQKRKSGLYGCLQKAPERATRIGSSLETYRIENGKLRSFTGSVISPKRTKAVQGQIATQFVSKGTDSKGAPRPLSLKNWGAPIMNQAGKRGEYFQFWGMSYQADRLSLHHKPTPIANTFTQDTFDFLTRASATIQKKLGKAPKICGINYVPKPRGESKNEGRTSQALGKGSGTKKGMWSFPKPAR